MREVLVISNNMENNSDDKYIVRKEFNNNRREIAIWSFLTISLSAIRIYRHINDKSLKIFTLDNVIFILLVIFFVREIYTFVKKNRELKKNCKLIYRRQAYY